MKFSPAPVRALYECLEVTFEPLTIGATVAPIFRDLADNAAYAPYLPLLHRVLVSRLLSQLSEVYSSINISHFISLVAPLNDAGLQGASTAEEGTSQVGIWDKEHIEAFVMSAARRGEILVRVDHAQGTLTFTDDIFISSPSANLQPSPGTLVVSRVNSLANTLHSTLQLLHPPTQTSQDNKLQVLVAAAEAERKAIQVRRSIVARRRELFSELSVRKEKEEASRKAEQTRREREEETKRAFEDIRRREMEKVRKTMENNRTEEARKLAQALKGTLKGPVEVSNTLLLLMTRMYLVRQQEMDTSDPDVLIRMQVAHLEKEKRDLNERLRIVSKRVDHVERAFRKEERPLLAEDYERQQADDREAFATNTQATLTASKEKHEIDMITKMRLSRMMDDYHVRHAAMMEKRNEDFKKREAAAQKSISEEKAKRLAERQAANLKAREEEDKRKAEEERMMREAEAEELRRQEGKTFGPRHTSLCANLYSSQLSELKKNRGAPKKRKPRLSCLKWRSVNKPIVRSGKRSVLRLSKPLACSSSARRMPCVARKKGRPQRQCLGPSALLRRLGGVAQFQPPLHALAPVHLVRPMLLHRHQELVRHCSVRKLIAEVDGERESKPDRQRALRQLLLIPLGPLRMVRLRHQNHLRMTTMDSKQCPSVKLYGDLNADEVSSLLCTFPDNSMTFNECEIMPTILAYSIKAYSIKVTSVKMGTTVGGFQTQVTKGRAS